MNNQRNALRAEQAKAKLDSFSKKRALIQSKKEPPLKKRKIEASPGTVTNQPTQTTAIDHQNEMAKQLAAIHQNGKKRRKTAIKCSKKLNSDQSSSCDQTDVDDQDSLVELLVAQITGEKFMPIFHTMTIAQHISGLKAIADQDHSRWGIDSTIERFSKQVSSFNQSDKWTIVHNIMNSLDSFGYQRNLAQMKMHMEMLPCIICSVFKYDVQTLRDQLMNVFGITRLHKELLLIASRRNGKTTAVLMMLCAILWWYPNVKIIMFSQNMDHTRELMSSLTQMLCNNPETKKMVPANAGTKKLTLKNPNDPSDIRTVLGISQKAAHVAALADILHTNPPQE